MSISSIQKTAVVAEGPGFSSSQKASAGAAGTSFASTLSQIGNGTLFSDSQVKGFFAGKPSEHQIATQAASLGLNEDHIVQAMRVGGYGGADASALRADIDAYVADPSNGYAWSANGTLIDSKASASAVNSPSDKVFPASQDIMAFYATNPSESQITAKVKSLGLNAAQMVQFEVIGEGMNLNQVQASVLETRFVDAANKLGTDIGGGKNGGWTSYFSPKLGRAVAQSEMQGFFSQNPTQSQVFQKAADLGLGVAAVNNMMVGLGMPEGNSTYGSRYNMMDTSLFQGRDGYSLDQYGHIVAGGGKQFIANADNSSGVWEARPDLGSKVNTSV